MPEADDQKDPGDEETEGEEAPFGDRKINDPLTVDADAPKEEWQPRSD